MKKFNVFWVLVMACTINMTPMFGQSESKKNKIIADSHAAKAEFIKKDALMKALFDKAYGYVIFPNVGKGGVAVGGASGNGVVYEHNAMIGMASLSQLSIGLQAGGQAYREVIFFESKKKWIGLKKVNSSFLPKLQQLP